VGRNLFVRSARRGGYTDEGFGNVESFGRGTELSIEIMGYYSSCFKMLRLV
jgi:hypothetical protein